MDDAFVQVYRDYWRRSKVLVWRRRSWITAAVLEEIANWCGSQLVSERGWCSKRTADAGKWAQGYSAMPVIWSFKKWFVCVCGFALAFVIEATASTTAETIQQVRQDLQRKQKASYIPPKKQSAQKQVRAGSMPSQVNGKSPVVRAGSKPSEVNAKINPKSGNRAANERRGAGKGLLGLTPVDPDATALVKGGKRVPGAWDPPQQPAKASGVKPVPGNPTADALYASGAIGPIACRAQGGTRCNDYRSIDAQKDFERDQAERDYRDKKISRTDCLGRGGQFC